MYAVPVENVFARSWRVLRRNPLLLVPALAAELVQRIATWPLRTGADVRSVSGSGVTLALLGWTHLLTMIFFEVVVALGVYTVAGLLQTGMAASAWRSGAATWQDGVNVLRRDSATLAVTALAYLGAMLAAMLLAPFSIGFSLMLAYFWLFYTWPALVIGGRTGVAALLDSRALANSRPGATIALCVGCVIVMTLSFAIAQLLGGIFVVGPLAAALLRAGAFAFTAVVAAGGYVNLRGYAEPPPL